MLAYGSANSYRLKYNISVDCLIGEKLFPQDIKQRELAYYRKIATSYGVALDNRNNYAKTDWLMWIAALGDEEECKRYLKMLVNFINDMPQWHPFPDRYNVENVSCYVFPNRTVQSGTFVPLLVKRFKK